MGNPQKIKERIKALFVWRDVTFTSYAQYISTKLGKNYTQSSLSHKLTRGTISFQEVIDIAETLGYDIIFKPRSNWTFWE